VKKSIAPKAIRSIFSSSSKSSTSPRISLLKNIRRSSGSDGDFSDFKEEPQEEEKGEEGIEVIKQKYCRIKSSSEHGTSCTEAHLANALLELESDSDLSTDEDQSNSQPQNQLESSKATAAPTNVAPTATPTQNGTNRNSLPPKPPNLKKGNVQLQINGRHIPQLDMMFSTKRQRNNNASGSFAFYSGYSDSEETSCRFVNGNGLRPSIDTLEFLMKDDNINDGMKEVLEQTIPTCTCHESIRNSPHHLCPAIIQQQQKQHQPQDNNNSAQNGTKKRGGILNYGRNLLRYTLFSKKGTIVATAEAHLYLWKSSDSVIVSDVDGTVTKSDIRGVINTVIQDQFDYCHGGICKFYHDMLEYYGSKNDRDENEDCRGTEISRWDNGPECRHSSASDPPPPRSRKDGEIRFLYLSSRPISLVSQTRKLLLSLQQTSEQKVYGLPPGPILCHTGPLSSVLYAELVAKNVHEFKADVLARQVVLPFVAARGEDWKVLSSRRRNGDALNETRDGDISKNYERKGSDRSWSGLSEVSSLFDDRLFLAGFGNKVTDAMAYEMAGIDRHDIYIIDKESRIMCMGADAGVDSRRGSVDEITEESDYSPTGLRCDRTDWSVTDTLCPGSKGESPPTLPLKDQNQVVADPIHSIELSISNETRGLNSAVESPSLSRAEVDIFFTEQKQSIGSASATKSSSSSKTKKIKRSIRAFSSKKSFTTKFPSLTSASGGGGNKSARKKLYDGYGDPLLLDRVRERMVR